MGRVVRAKPGAPDRVRLGALSFLRVLFFFAFWMLLVDEPDVPSLVTGAVVALLAAVMTLRLQALRPVRIAPRPTMLRHAHRPFVLLVTDTWRVIAVLLKALRPGAAHRTGRFRAARYGACEQEPADAARRVLTEWGASLGANRYVIGIDSESRVLIVHELKASEGPLDPLELG